MFQLEYATWFNKLFTSTRASTLYRSCTRKVRDIDPFSVNWLGPVIESRRASPNPGAIPAEPGVTYLQGFRNWPATCEQFAGVP